MSTKYFFLKMIINYINITKSKNIFKKYRLKVEIEKVFCVNFR